MSKKEIHLVKTFSFMGDIFIILLNCQKVKDCNVSPYSQLERFTTAGKPLFYYPLLCGNIHDKKHFIVRKIKEMSFTFYYILILHTIMYYITYYKEILTIKNVLNT